MASMPTFRLVTASAEYGSRKIKSKRRNRRTQNLVPGARIELATPASSVKGSRLNISPRLLVTQLPP